MAAHRYWQIDIHTCTAGVFGALTKTEMAASVGGTNLSTVALACFASSSQGGQPPSAALLGGAFWAGAGALPVQWWYDFVTPQDIVEVRITPLGGLEPYYPLAWDLRSSDDAITWTTEGSFTAAAWVAGVMQTFDLAPPPPPPAAASGFFRSVF